MQCAVCGTQVVESGAFCHKCGARLEAENPASPSSDQPAVESGQAAVRDQEPPAASARERFLEAANARRSAADDPEKDLWVGTYSPKDMIGTWALYGAITVVAIAVWLWLGGWAYWGIPAIAILLLWCYGLGTLAYRRLSVRYRLTSKRFFHEKGILRRVTDRIEMIDMDDITVVQTIIDRMFGVGTIRITSSDRTHPALVLRGIEDVQHVAGMMDEARLSERRRRGVHIEAV